VTERFAKSSGSDSARSSPIEKKPKPVIPGGVDVAARRARLQNKLQASGAGGSRAGRHDVKRGISKSTTRTPKQRALSGPILQPTVFQSKPGVPELSVSTENDAHETSSHDEYTPVTEVDESPILGHEITYPATSPAYHSSSLSHAEHIPTAEPKTATENNLLGHIMSIRQSSASISPKTQAVEDFLSERDEGETIQIILGATPVLPQSHWKGDDVSPDSAFGGAPEPIPEDAAEFFDARSEIRPEDSVSMVFGQQQGRQEDRNLASRYPVPLIPQAFTLDSEARSQINHVLDHYREGVVTPEMAYGFQETVSRISPLLPQHNAWTSREATEHYLEAVLEAADSEMSTPTERDSEAAAEPAPELEMPMTGLRPNFDEPDPEEFEEEVGGTAIIYSQPERYRPASTDSMEHRLNQHSHTASNATLRPSKSDEMTNGNLHLPGLEFVPTVPPEESAAHRVSSSEQRPRLPEISTGGDGLGLSMDSNRPVTPASPLPPARAPPPPPTSKDDLTSMAIRILGPASEGILPIARYPSDPFSSSSPVSPVARSQTRHVPGDVRHHDGHQSGKASMDVPRESEVLRYGSLDGRPEEDARAVQHSGPQHSREKELNERKNCIKELVDTEHSYSQDMTIMEDIYMGTASSVLVEEDRKALFGNLDQVRAFSVQFLDSLKHACSTVYTIPRENRWNFKRGSYGTSYTATTEASSSAGGPSERERIALDEKSTIGQTFLNHLGQIENVYREWIVKTNESANVRLNELQQKPGVKLWLDECYASAKDITQAWSLDALMIKPAQRLMKYPLLLASILKRTPKSHPDFDALKSAHETILEVVSRINAAKKRSELVDQAMNPKQRKDSESKMRVGKLLNRRTEKLKQQVGLSIAADDQEYEAIAQKFGGHFFQLQIVMRDVEKYLEDMQTSIEWLHMFVRSLVQYSQLESQERWPEYESNWIRLSLSVQEILEIALQEHVSLLSVKSTACRETNRSRLLKFAKVSSTQS
jgi:dynamin-binding protein